MSGSGADARAKRKYEKQLGVEAKRRRLENKKSKANLRYEKENSEGATYENNIAFIYLCMILVTYYLIT